MVTPSIPKRGPPGPHPRPRRSAPRPAPTPGSCAQPGPAHLPAPRALETRPAARGSRKRLPECPAERSGAGTEARGTPSFAAGTSSCGALHGPLSFSIRPPNHQPQKALRRCLLAELHFPEGPQARLCSALRCRLRGPALGATLGDPGHSSDLGRQCVRKR